MFCEINSDMMLKRTSTKWKLFRERIKWCEILMDKNFGTCLGVLYEHIVV